MQLLIFNEEFLVSVCHQRTLITSLPFVHTARRSYRLNDPVRPPDCGAAAGSPALASREAVRTLSFRGRRSRNKVSVGEPAEGSLPVFPPHTVALSAGASSGARAARLVPFRCAPDARASGPGSAPRALPGGGGSRLCRLPSRGPGLRGSDHIPIHTTPADGYLGSRNDEERSEMRYVVRIAEFSESSNL